MNRKAAPYTSPEADTKTATCLAGAVQLTLHAYTLASTGKVKMPYISRAQTVHNINDTHLPMLPTGPTSQTPI